MRPGDAGCSVLLGKVSNSTRTYEQWSAVQRRDRRGIVLTGSALTSTGSPVSAACGACGVTLAAA